MTTPNNKRFDQHFKIFAKSLEFAIAASETDKSQKEQVESLIRLENEFRKELNDHPAGRAVYKKFIEFILDEKKNILSARPYFRERQKKFSSDISPAFKIRNAKAFQRFRVNFTFIKFAMKVYTGKGRRLAKLRRLEAQITHERDELVKRNLPLAINRAKIFWSKVPKVNHEYMDMVQLAAEGLISAVDKFVPPFRTVFRSVAIGRMVGNMVEASSETMLHFYPMDKRKLYKANSLKHRNKLESVEAIADAMNKEPIEEGKERDDVTPSEMYNILSGSSHISMDSSPATTKNNEPDLITLHSKTADEGPNQEEEYETMESLRKIREAFERFLGIIERKIFALKGQYYD